MGQANRSIKICGMAMFDWLVLEISLVESSKTLHAHFYLYELVLIPSGVSIVTLSAENRAEESILYKAKIIESDRFHD